MCFPVCSFALISLGGVYGMEGVSDHHHRHYHHTDHLSLGREEQNTTYHPGYKRGERESVEETYIFVMKNEDDE